MNQQMDSEGSRLLQSEPGALHGWPETLFLTLLTIGLPFWINPDDPLLHESRFDWQMFAPLLLAMHYGLLRGMVCLLAITLSHYLIHPDTILSADSSDQARLTGWAIVILICGEYSNFWKSRNGALNEHYRYLKDRFDTFTRYYHLLQTSHNRLEKLMAGQATSLRETLLKLQSKINQQTDEPLTSSAPYILNTLCEFGGIQRAGFFLSKDGETLAPEIVAQYGSASSLNPSDPLVKAMLQQKATVSLRDSTPGARYQLCIPISDITDKLYGAILVEDIQFFSLQNKNINLLSVIAGHVGDLIRHSVTNPVLELDELESFKSSIAISGRSNRYSTSPGRLVSIRGSHSSTLPLFTHMEKTRRSLDIYLKVSPTHFLVLLPFAAEHESAAFVQRIERWWHERCQITQDKATLDVSSYSLSEKDQVEKLLSATQGKIADESVSAY